MSSQHKASDIQYACIAEFERELTNLQMVLQKALQNSGQNALQPCGEACKDINYMSPNSNGAATSNYEIIAAHFAKLCNAYFKIKVLIDDIRSPDYVQFREAIRNLFEKQKSINKLLIMLTMLSRPNKDDVPAYLDWNVS